MVDLVGLAEMAPKRVAALSGGQRRRVVLAQAMLGDPDLLVLDEPTTGLDPAQRGRLRDVLGRAGESATVLISTHQTADVAALCERVVVLGGGRSCSTAPSSTWSPGRGAGMAGPGAASGRATRMAHRDRPGAQRRRPTPDVDLIEPDLEDAYLLLVGEARSDSALEAAS